VTVPGPVPPAPKPLASTGLDSRLPIGIAVLALLAGLGVYGGSRIRAARAH
jgi:hypothetical protein